MSDPLKCGECSHYNYCDVALKSFCGINKSQPRQCSACEHARYATEGTIPYRCSLTGARHNATVWCKSWKCYHKTNAEQKLYFESETYTYLWEV